MERITWRNRKRWTPQRMKSPVGRKAPLVKPSAKSTEDEKSPLGLRPFTGGASHLFGGPRAFTGLGGTPLRGPRPFTGEKK